MEIKAQAVMVKLFFVRLKIDPDKVNTNRTQIQGEK